MEPGKIKYEIFLFWTGFNIHIADICRRLKTGLGFLKQYPNEIINFDSLCAKEKNKTISQLKTHSNSFTAADLLVLISPLLLFFSVLSLSLPLIEISWREKMNKNTKKSYCRLHLNQLSCLGYETKWPKGTRDFKIGLEILGI